MLRSTHKGPFGTSRVGIAGLGLLVLLGFAVELGHAHDSCEPGSGDGCAVCAATCVGKWNPGTVASAALSHAPCDQCHATLERNWISLEIRTALHSRAPPAASVPA